MVLRCVPVGADSPFLGLSLKESGLRNHYHCLVAGVEKNDGTLHTPDVNLPFEQGDILWLVGEAKDVDRLMGN